MKEQLDQLKIKLFQCPPLADKYAKGMTTRDIQSHVTELYSIDISPTLVSNITNKLIDLAEEWHSRPLEKVYPIIFLDAIHYKIRDEDTRKVVSKAAYTCLAIDSEGHKDLLGLWVAEAEGANPPWRTGLTF